jgi:hypothetical protein
MKFQGHVSSRLQKPVMLENENATNEMKLKCKQTFM